MRLSEQLGVSGKSHKVPFLYFPFLLMHIKFTLGIPTVKSSIESKGSQSTEMQVFFIPIAVHLQNTFPVSILFYAARIFVVVFKIELICSISKNEKGKRRLTPFLSIVKILIH